MVPVYGKSMPQADFLGTIDKMIKTQFTFMASGICWILDEIVGLDVKFANFSLISGSSSIHTPPDLKTSRLLLNIRNHQDYKCFL